jgi:DNA polymerase delta subunit OB-fold domain/DNA polymerase alpha/epsilon subunit B
MKVTDLWNQRESITQ